MGFMDSLGSNLTNALSWVVNLLPNSPFQSIDNSAVNTFMGGLNWILPLDKIVAELQAWLACVLIFYAYQIILRWVRAIG
jgi:hypothetical protein